MPVPRRSSEPPPLATPDGPGVTGSPPATRREDGPLPAPERPRISLVVPVFDEEENLARLCAEIREVLDGVGLRFEVILVDDGSRDGSFRALQEIAGRDARFRVLRFRRNYGQTAALTAGFDHAAGEIIIPLDADLQNDPRDIPALLAKLEEGYDVVSGWRKSRQDPWHRSLPSRIANGLISRMTGIHLHDSGCSLKAYRAEILDDLHLYGETHRLIPAYAALEGARVTELPVRHHPRTAGKAKYGLGRTGKVLLDLLVVRLLAGYSTRPMHLFGGVGLFLCAGGIVSGAAALAERVLADVRVHRNPLILLAVFLFLLGVQLILMGFLAELHIRTYHEATRRPTYRLRESVNFPQQPVGGPPPQRGERPEEAPASPGPA
jgi:glycosyltransferase involved in cell wall biosynthesis